MSTLLEELALEDLARITPTGILLGDPEPETPEWFAIRRGGITATDLPRILGLSQYGNARSVWHDKRRELAPEPAGEAAQWGHLLEDVVAQEWARRTGNDVEPIGVICHITEPWMRASCDRRIVGHPGALEIKTRSAFTAGKWRDDIPDDVLAQVAWQRLVTGFGYIEVACLLGGQRLVTYRYEQDSQLEDYLVSAASQLWYQVIVGEPPAADMDGVLLRLLEHLYPDRSGEREIAAAEAVELIQAHGAAGLEVQQAEARKEQAKVAVVSALGEAEVLTLHGEPIFTYREQAKHSVNLTDLENHDVELYEQVLAGGHITTTTSRVLRAAKGAKNV